MKFNLVRTLSIFVLFIAAAAFTGVNGQTVTGSIAGGTVTRGKAAKATVTLSLPSELHVNSNRPGTEYQIPTTVRVTAPGITIGPVTYPRGHDKKFAFSENTINIYDGRTTFRFNVTVPRSFRGDRISIRVAVRYQACTDEVCYPPKTKEITLTAKVK